MEQELSAIAGNSIKITFTPHLLPVKRGILSTIYALPQDGIEESALDSAFTEEYAGEKFIRYQGQGKTPRTKDVAGTNFCDISFHLDSRPGRAIIISAIDNLGKGAAGQAIQNMNIMCGLPEDMALSGPSFFI